VSGSLFSAVDAVQVSLAFRELIVLVCQPSLPHSSLSADNVVVREVADL
jgi:hypothetical protein